MRTVFFAAILLVLSACQQTPMPRDNAQDIFNGPVFRLNVAQINVTEDYQTSKSLPHVDGLASPTPARMVKDWAQTHLVAAGSTGSAEVDIKDAHILKKAITKQKTGIEGFFTNEQTEQYDGQLTVEVKIFDGVRIFPAASVVASSQSMRTLGEDASLIDRQNTYHDISVELIKTLEPEVDRNISNNFSKYLLQ